MLSGTAAHSAAAATAGPRAQNERTRANIAIVCIAANRPMPWATATAGWPPSPT